jgi:penicillin-binding protein 1C
MPSLILLALVLSGCVAERSASSPSYSLYRQRLRALRTQNFFQTTRLVDRNGRLLAEIAPHGRRVWVALDQIPARLRQAVIATEDRTFYTNTGVDTRAVARAALQNAQAGTTVSGASTITMQLARLVAFDPEERYAQTLERKLREVHLAAEMAEQYSKGEILEAYLNVAYFGHGAYGVEAAADTYFDRRVGQLTATQATLLAGLLQAPELLDPLRNPVAARERHQIVLHSMVEAGYLGPAEADAIWRGPLALVDSSPSSPRRANHFVDYIQQVLPSLVGRELAARGGFTVTTTIDVDLNDAVRALAERHIAALRASHDVTDAAVVVMRPETGEILAMVGGLDYNEARNGQVNMAIQPRQPGSAFKPVTYATALEGGWTPASILWDVPLSFPVGDGTSYRPTNYDRRYRGPVRMREALGNSLNAAAVDLLGAVGVEQTHHTATRMGLSLHPDPWRYGLSLTLGGAEVSLLELTSAFGTFAAAGTHMPVVGVLRIDPLDGGDPVYVHAPRPTRVVSPQTAWLVADMLSDRDARRPAFPADSPLETSRTTAVKTGTTNDFRDNVTVGFTPYVVVGVWAGNKDGRPMRDVAGITGAAPIWHDTMEMIFGRPELLRQLGDGQPPPEEFTPPAGIVQATVCDLRSLTTAGACRQVSEVFASGSPTRDEGGNTDWFAIHQAFDGPEAVGDAASACADRSSEGRPGAQLLLRVNRTATVAAQIREWSAERGIRVAPPPCDGDLAAQLAGPGAPEPLLLQP